MQRFNSIVAIKKGCVDCEPGNQKGIYALDRCPYHYRIFNNKARQDKVRHKEQPSNELDIWFEQIAVNVIEPNPFCWMCSEEIPPKYWRHATAHIFAKSIFKSVATHPQNFLIACAGNGCHHITEDWEKLYKSVLWQTALERIKIIYPHIQEYQKNNLPEFLLKLINCNT